MSKELVATTTIKTTGQKVTYIYRDVWGKRYYSFDFGKTWDTSKLKAYEHMQKM